MEDAARITALGVALLAVIAVIDLATGSLVDDKRMDAGLLLACGLGLSGALGARRVARRFREGPLPPGMSVGQWLWFAASSAMTVAVTGVVGYLIGGWWIATGIPAAVLATISVVVLVTRRRASA